MLKVYFGEWGNGRLKRLAYLGYYFLLIFIMFAIMFGAIMAVGATEKVMGGDIMATQTMFMDHFGIIAVIGIVVLMFALMLAQINILAKRIRDMGLPPVWTILGIIAVSMVLNMLFPSQVVEVNTAVVQTAEGTASAVAAATQTTASPIVQLFDLALFLCLVLIPSDAFSKNR